MSTVFYSLSILILCIFLILGCSTPGVTPTNPNVMPDDSNSYREPDSQHVMWGMWDIYFDVDNLEVVVVPVRNLEAHFNVTSMLQPPNCPDCLTIKVNSFDQVTRIIDVDATLRNPTSIAGKDVRGILFTNAVGHELTNWDDWTSKFDIAGGMEINPFRAFAKAEPNRIFAGMRVTHPREFDRELLKPRLLPESDYYETTLMIRDIGIIILDCS